MNRRAKSTELATVPDLPADRVNQVFNWIIAGGSEHDITDAIAQTWEDAKAMPLIVAAMQRIAKSADAEPDVIRGWCIEATRHVYQKAIEVGDLATALRAVKQLQGMASG